MKVTKIVIWSVISIMLLSLLISLLAFQGIRGFFWSSSNENKIVILEKEYSVDEIENIKLDWTSGNVSVLPTTGDTIKLVQKANRELDDKQKLQVNISNNTLSMKEGKGNFQFFFFGFGYRSTSLELYLPEKVYNNVNIKSTSGSIEIEKLDCKSFVGKLTSGKITIDDLTATKSDLDLTSGKIDIYNLVSDDTTVKMTSGSSSISGSMKKINLKCTSGKLELTNNVLPDDLYAEMTSGKIEVSIPENDGFDLEYKMTSGSFKTDFDLYSKLDNNDKKNGSGKYKDGGSTLYFKGTSGTIKLNRI